MNSNPVYIVGGQQKKAFTRPNEEYTRYANGVCAEYNCDSETGKLLLSYQTADEHCAQTTDKSILFKSGSISKDEILLCTQTEVLICTFPELQILQVHSHPNFNDVHHVVKSTSGSLLIASTGLDMVIEMDPDNGHVIQRWDTLKRKLWEKRDASIDYRQVLTTKPHDSHPNFIFQYGDEIWVTRFEQKDAISLTNDRRIDIGIERPHDGHVLGNQVYFTTVDGHVVIADLETTEVTDVIDLHKCKNAGQATGWARGLKIIDNEHVIVAFSTLRVTKIRENIRWIKQRFGALEHSNPTPTHIAKYNLTTKTMLWRKELEDPCIDVIFSIL